KNLIQLMRGLDKVKSGHRRSTPACPPPSRFMRAVQAGWTAEERLHAADCSYCARVSMMHVDEVHPNAQVMMEHLLLFANTPEMGQHIRNCAPCAMQMQSAFVERLLARQNPATAAGLTHAAAVADCEVRGTR